MSWYDCKIVIPPHSSSPEDSIGRGIGLGGKDKLPVTNANGVWGRKLRRDKLEQIGFDKGTECGNR